MAETRALFLVEAGRRSGLGHLRRMQVLARTMMQENWVCRFGVDDASVIDNITQTGFDAYLWINDGIDLGPADIVVVDGYHYDPDLLKRWRDHCRVSVAVDDNADRPLAADIILNHNIYGHQLNYSAYSAIRLLTGPQYCLVDSRFAGLADERQEQRQRLLVTFGGTDDGRYSLSIVRGLLSQRRSLVVEVVISPLRQPCEKWVDLRNEFDKRLVIHHGIDMVDVMGRCSVMVGAAGVSVVEALAAGILPIVCATVGNQRRNVEALRELGIIAMDHYDAKEMVKAALVTLDCAGAGYKPVSDWRGPDRVVEEIRLLMSKG